MTLSRSMRLAALIGYVAILTMAFTDCGGIKVPSCILDGSCLPKPDCRTVGCPAGEQCAEVPDSRWSARPEDADFACVPGPAPEPSPSPSPTPISVPRPTPVPVPLLTANGNYPLPPIGTCPPEFQDAPFSLHIKLWQRTCGQGRVCIQTTASVTQRVAKPYLEHTCYDEDGSYSPANCKHVGEMWRGCQEPQFVDYVSDFAGDPNPGDGIYMVIFGNLPFGRMDKQTCTMGCPAGMQNPVHNFNAHDKAVDRLGSTTLRACMADGTHCTELSYRTDQ